MSGAPYLRLLGACRLEPWGFTQARPLLLLAYATVEGVRNRAELAERLWGGNSSRLRHKGLSEALRRLKPFSLPVVGSGDRELRVTVASDVADFLDALARSDYRRALDLYRGPFLPGLERSPRLALGSEIIEWIVRTREDLHTRALEGRLALAELLALADDFVAAGELAAAAAAPGPSITYPGPEEYRRIHTLLLAGDRPDDAELVRRQAHELYGDLGLASGPVDARERLLPAVVPLGRSSAPYRESEVADILARLSEPARVVTITGPVGIGKTTVAAAVARKAGLGSFRNALAWVSLREIGADALLPQVIEQIATALALGDAATLGALESRLVGHRRLLVLDNAEHLVAPLREIAALCGRLPGLRLLITSRTQLEVPSESVVRLLGLPVPPEGSTADLDRYGAVALFVEAARRHGHLLSERDLPEVAAIARLVEGHPLTLEIAAGWVAVLSLPEIRAGLAAGSLPQGELESALASTWELLAEAERRALSSLAVFRGGFAREAVETVIGVTLPQLRGLMNWSLVRRDANGRFDLHPLIERFAGAMLEQTAAAPELRATHARHYFALLTQFGEPGGPEGLANELPNVAAAWQWQIAQGGERSAELARPLGRLCDEAARYRFGSDLLERAEANADETTRGALQAERAWLLMRTQEYETAERLARAALDLPVASRARTTALNALGALLDVTGRPDEAEPVFREALALQDPDSGRAAAALLNLALLARRRGRHAEATRLAAEAQALFERLGFRREQLNAALVQAEIATDTGSLAEAQTLLERALTDAERSSDRHWSRSLRQRLAWVLLDRGRPQEAATLAAGVRAEGVGEATAAELWGIEARAAATERGGVHAAYLFGLALDAGVRSGETGLILQILSGVAGLLGEERPAAELLDFLEHGPLAQLVGPRARREIAARRGTVAPPELSARWRDFDLVTVVALVKARLRREASG